MRMQNVVEWSINAAFTQKGPYNGMRNSITRKSGHMDQEQARRLGAHIREARVAKELSSRELARRVGVNDATIVRIEQGAFESPRPHTLAAIAGELSIPLSDVFALADYVVPDELPTFQPYLRAKYGDLPPEAMAELEASFANIAKRHGYDGKGPAPGQDET